MKTGGDRSAHGIYLLFAAGKRPDLAALHEFVAARDSVTISYEPGQQPPVSLVEDKPKLQTGPADDLLWVELLREGLTFDLEGIGPSHALPIPEFEHFFDCEPTIDTSQFEALRLVVGEHLSGGERTLPVMRGMAAVARDMVNYFKDIAAIVWPPAASIVGRRFFDSTITEWVEGGAFPALGLTAFRQSEAGGLESVGLDFFIGQELLIEAELARDKVAATRLGFRLINQLLMIGGIESAERVISPDGTRLVLTPSRNGRFVRARRE